MYRISEDMKLVHSAKHSLTVQLFRTRDAFSRILVQCQQKSKQARLLDRKSRAIPRALRRHEIGLLEKLGFTYKAQEETISANLQNSGGLAKTRTKVTHLRVR